MKAFRVFLFILVTLLLLVAVSFIIPDGRIQIGNITLKYPTAKQVLALDTATDTTEIIPPWEQAELQIRSNLAQKQLSKREQIAYRITHEPTAIMVPNDSIAYFNDFFTALSKAHNEPIRILHIGDSQIEEDRITGYIREQFQSTYGGNGPGLIPAIQTVQTTAIHQSCTADMRRYMVYGPANYRHQDNLYGIMGQMAHLQGKATWNFSSPQMSRTRPGTRHYSKITFMVGQPKSETVFYASRNDYHSDTLSIDTTIQAIQFITLQLEGTGAKGTVTANGDANIYGIMLDGNSGVSMDNVPMRGSAGTTFTSINAETLIPYFRHYKVPLIILQFGGNTVPYLKGTNSIESYCNGIARQLRYLKRISPNSTLLFVGPSDMATSIDGVFQTYPELPRIVNALKACCLENGVAYWDLYSSMGGRGSMLQWANTNPPLAGSDYVHFTPRGADKAAEMLYESLIHYHSYFIEQDSL